MELLNKGTGDVGALSELAELITDSKSASDTFEDFGSELGAEKQLLLLSEVYAVMRKRHKAHANADDSPGFFAPWRLVQRQGRPQGFSTWIVRELAKYIPANLRLMKDIYYYWLGGDQHSRNEREEARHITWQTLKVAWEQMSPLKIADGFDAVFPYTLFHIIFTSDCKVPETVPYGRIEDWAWMMNHLLEACRSSPEVMIPQIVFAVHDISLPVSRELDYRFNRHVLDCLFGKSGAEILNLIANGFPIANGTDAQSAYLLRLATARAKAELASGNEASGHESPR